MKRKIKKTRKEIKIEKLIKLFKNEVRYLNKHYKIPRNDNLTGLYRRVGKVCEIYDVKTDEQFKTVIGLCYHYWLFSFICGTQEIKKLFNCIK